MKKQPSIRELLSRSFSGIKVNPLTGEKDILIIDGHLIVNNHMFLAPFEIDLLEKEIRKYSRKKTN